MKKIVFLASGSGGNLKFLHLAQKYSLISNINLFVVADRECGSVEFARNNTLSNDVITYTKLASEELTLILERINPDLIVTNWHKIIDEDTVRAYQGKMLNLHYSLLPAFSGLIGTEPIKRAYSQGCKYIGPTCHLVDEGVDSGKIISQAIFTTDISFDNSINLMFRMGCLVLLNGIEQVMGKITTSNSLKSIHSLSFSPPLGFDENVFSESFWKELSRL
jgi:phosphoribosylglycinamide formyltransferase-1